MYAAPIAAVPTSKAATTVGGLFSSVGQAIRTFSVSAVRGSGGSSGVAIASLVRDVALATPPLAYFGALLAAGFGVPVSEDALCIFAGATMSALDNRSRQVRLLVALYLGVVMSDAVTFFLGRALRFGLLEPLRRQLDLVEANQDSQESLLLTRKQEYWNRLGAKLHEAGDSIGFVIRFSVGMRAPLMLLTGFTGQVSFGKFVAGAAVGAIFSLAAQLVLGYSMRNNQQAVFRAVASFSSLVLAAPLVAATVLGGLLFIKQARGQKAKEQGRPTTTTPDETPSTTPPSNAKN